MPRSFLKRMNERAAALSETETDASSDTFEAFFRREHGRLLKALYLASGDPREAEELMQEAFLRVWERWDRVAVMDDPTGYLFRTAMNLFRSRLRRAMLGVRRIVQPSRPPDPIEEVDARDAVVRILATLPPRQRAALILTDFLGHDSEEAGRILGVKPVTVRSLASQARSALRSRMEVADE